MNFLLRASVFIIALALSACIFDSPSPPSTAPANVTVTAGEALVAMDWDVEPGLTYWIFYKKGTDTGLDDYDNILTNASPPVLVQGLENGTQYAFSVTSSKDGSKVGPFSPVWTATPRLLTKTILWDVGTSLTSNVENLSSIAFGNNTYVTVGEVTAGGTATIFVGPYSYTDIGGVTGWSSATTLPAGLTANLTAVIFDGTRFVALGDDGSVIKSTDADTYVWEDATDIVGATQINAVAVGVGAYVAVGNSGEIYTNTSADISAAWTLQTSGVTDHLYGVSYVNGRFIAVGASGTLLVSADAGVTWAPPTTMPVGLTETLRQVAYGANADVASAYVAVGDAGTVVSSTDADTWTLQADPTGATLNLNAIIFGTDNQFITVGEAGTLVYSVTGADGSWDKTTAGSITLNSIAVNYVHIAVGDTGANVSGK